MTAEEEHGESKSRRRRSERSVLKRRNAHDDALEVEELDEVPRDIGRLLSALPGPRADERPAEPSRLMNMLKRRVDRRVCRACRVRERRRSSLANSARLGPMGLSPLVEVVASCRRRRGETRQEQCQRGGRLRGN